MATLDDKLLGEKLHYYCSSSEDEDEAGGGLRRTEPDQPAPALPAGGDGSSNTGPKGVLKDWQRFKQLETERREEADLEKLALAKKLNLSCRTEREDAEARERERRIEEELEDIFNDDFMQQYMEKRMAEMMNSVRSQKIFGELVELNDGQEFLDAIDSEDKASTILILIHSPGVEGCDAMLGCVRCLAPEYRTVKFCAIQGSAAGLSRHFKVAGVPALLVYRAGQLTTTFIRLTDQLGDDFYAADVEAFLVEHAVLPNKEDVPKIIRGPADNNDDDDD